MVDARRSVFTVCIALFFAFYAIGFTAYALSDARAHNDFFGIWGWARFEIEHPPSQIYDHATQSAFLLSLDSQVPGPMPFAYPPTYLLLIRPLGWLSYPVAYAIWSWITLLCFLAALWNREAPLQAVLLALLSPATLENLKYGQNGFLTAALLVGGLRLAPSRPLLGGVLLGLLSYKPQFGFLVAIALASAGLWFVALATLLTVAISVAASLLAFGVAPWIAWIHSIPEFGKMLYSQGAHLLPLMPTALSNALVLGASEQLAAIIQTAVTIAAAAGVWFAFRRGAGKSAIAVLAVASILATPYAFVYDLTLVTAAVVLVHAEYWSDLSLAEVLVIAVAMLLPFGMDLNVPVATAVHAVLLGMILLHLSRISPPCPQFEVRI